MQDMEQPTLSPRRNLWAFYLSLSLLAPLFFLSLVFSIFAPLPILYLHQGTDNRSHGRRWAFFASAFGILLCVLLRGLPMAGAFTTLAVLPALLIAEILERKAPPEFAIFTAWIGVCAAIILSASLYSHLKHIDLVPFLKTQFTQSIQVMSKKLLENEKSSGSTALSEEELKKIVENPGVLVEELPGILLAITLVLCTLPTLAVLRWNPKGMSRRLGIPRDVWRRWKSPEWLVWPALACGVFLVFDYEPYSSVANDLLKPILVIYFFQGMSILAYFLDSIRIRGPIRAILYSAGILFLTPMIVSFGFFDLWFNFRGRGKKRTDGEDNL